MNIDIPYGKEYRNIFFNESYEILKPNEVSMKNEKIIIKKIIICYKIYIMLITKDKK